MKCSDETGQLPKVMHKLCDNDFAKMRHFRIIM